MALIAISSVKLAVDTFFLEEPPDSLIIIISEDYIDYILNFCFIIEMIIKVISLGFVMDEGSYLRESWN